jgi:hypothetical protein
MHWQANRRKQFMIILKAAGHCNSAVANMNPQSCAQKTANMKKVHAVRNVPALELKHRTVMMSQLQFAARSAYCCLPSVHMPISNVHPIQRKIYTGNSQHASTAAAVHLL